MRTLHELLYPYYPAILKGLFAFIIVLLGITADLLSGIRKAKAKGVFTHTYGIDRTLDKLRKRYNLLVVFALLDTIIIISEVHSNMIPYCTLFAAFVMVIVEVKSILEKDEDKGRYIEAANMAREAWKGVDKEEIADIIIKKLKKEKENDNETKP